MIDQNTATGSMNATGTRDTTRTQQPCGIDTVRPLVESFIRRLTPEKWRMLSFGSPDEATKIMLADMLLDIKTSMSKALLAYLNSPDTSGRFSLCMYSATNGLTQNFADTLGVSDSVQSDSLKLLSDLVSEEVRESVYSALSASDETDEPVTIQHMTPPSRLNAMVEHASKMFTVLAAKMKFSPKPGYCGRRKEGKKSSEVSQTLVGTTSVGTTSVGTTSVGTTSVGTTSGGMTPAGTTSGRTVEPDSAEKVSSEDSFLRATATAALSIIRKELDDFTEPVLDDSSVYDMLQSLTSQEMVVLAEDIADVIAEKTVSLEEMVQASPSPKPEQRNKLKVLGGKIKTFLAKSLAKAGICCIAAKLKAQFHQDTRAESDQSLQVLMESIDSLLQTELGESDGENELAQIPFFQRLSTGQFEEATEELSSVLYDHITEEIVPEVLPEIQTLGGQTCQDSDVAVQDAITYSDVEVLVLNFLTLMGWWLNTQSDIQSQRVTQTLMYQVPKTASKCEEPLQAVQHKMSVKLLVEMVVWETFLKVHVLPENKDYIIQRLFNIIWAKVEGSDLNIRSVKKLKTAIFKDLIEMSGSEEALLLSLKLENPQLDNCIASIFKDHLTTPPKQPCAICRFFSSVGKVLAKPFRRRASVGVLGAV